MFAVFPVVQGFEATTRLRAKHLFEDPGSTTPLASRCGTGALFVIRDRRHAMSCMSRPGSRVIGEQYQVEFADDVMMRLQQAGVRLAELIRTNLTPLSR